MHGFSIQRRATLALSVVMAAAASVSWVRSYWIVDRITFSRLVDTRGTRIESADIVRGEWVISSVSSVVSPRVAFAPKSLHQGVETTHPPISWYPRPSNSGFFQRLGFDLDRWHVSSRSVVSDYWRLVLPHWLLVMVLLAFPVLELHALRRRHVRRSAGLCKTCGYDLRASPDQCPECGTRIRQ